MSPISRRDRLAERDMLEGVERICRERHVLLFDALGDSRDQAVVRCRWAVWEHLIETHGMSAKGVSVLLGVHHTSVLYALRKTPSLIRKACLADRVALAVEAMRVA